MPAPSPIFASPTGPGGTCYRVLLWEHDALEPQAWHAWQRTRTDLLARMREAGIKGSRGLLAALETQLKQAAAEHLETPLATCPQAALSYARVGAMAAALQADSGVLAYRLTPCAARILIQLGPEESMDALVASWKASCPDITWCREPWIEALPAAEAAAWQQHCREEAPAPEAEEDSADAPFHHVTVLAQEAVDALRPAPGRVYVDATLGGGGHSERLLQAGATVWGIDQDPAARRAARQRLASYGDRLHVLAGNFRQVADLLREAGVESVDGLLADIGISSPQVDQAERGFSFLQEGPLDMRMNPLAGPTAADLLNSADEATLADWLWQYGEERASRAIARRIIEARRQAPLTTTTQLADLIASVLPRKGRQHPATRSFQALRIVVNDELGALNALLEQALGLLKSGGRLAIITFHSLEDRAVKRWFDHITRPEIDRPEWPEPRPNPAYGARLITRKPITASTQELAANPRSRSAKLRVIEKL